MGYSLRSYGSRGPLGTLSFTSPVFRVLVAETRFAVVLQTQVCVYPLTFEREAEVAAEHVVDTGPNPRGIAAWSVRSPTLCLPGVQRGTLRICTLDAPASRVIVAHRGAVHCVAVAPDGARVASASDKGTVIRVFATDGHLLAEHQRGYQAADIHTLLFSPRPQGFLVAVTAGRLTLFTEEGNQPGKWGAIVRAVGLRKRGAPTYEADLDGEGEWKAICGPDEITLAASNKLVMYRVRGNQAHLLQTANIESGQLVVTTPCTTCSLDPEHDESDFSELPPLCSGQPSSFMREEDEWSLVQET